MYFQSDIASFLRLRRRRQRKYNTRSVASSPPATSATDDNDDTNVHTYLIYVKALARGRGRDHVFSLDVELLPQATK